MRCQQKSALIITADDFGLHSRVNQAVALAHEKGVLTAASLMVGAPAAQEAIALARELPNLAVGLHLVLADGEPVLSVKEIPDLLDDQGRFSERMFKNGVRFFCLPHVRAQLRREIEAQFALFAQTGLALDHVNAHKHFHLHPAILTDILHIGQRFGLRAVRLPSEVKTPLWLKPWIALVRWRLKRAHLFFNDYIYGMAHSGNVNEATWLALLANLPTGVGEIYCHPATGEDYITSSMRHYRHEAELNALLSPRVQSTLHQLGVLTGGFAEIERKWRIAVELEH